MFYKNEENVTYIDFNNDNGSTVELLLRYLISTYYLE